MSIHFSLIVVYFFSLLPLSISHSSDIPSWGYDFGGTTDANLEEVKGLAASGNSEAMLHLGEAYRSGLLATGFDFESSLFWYSRAAEAGNAQAKLQLWQIYNSGQGVAVDKDKAMAHLEEAADLGHFEAEYYLANSMLYDSDADASDRLKGIRIMVGASKKAPGFLARRGVSIFTGEYLSKLPKNETTSICGFLETAASDSAGIDGSLVGLANCIDEGYEVSATSGAITPEELREEAARRGQIFFKVPTSFSQRGLDFLTAAQLSIENLAYTGHKHSLMVIADCHIFGSQEGSHASCFDQVKGFEWNKMAAEQIGNVFFPEWLAYRYRNGIGTPSNLRAAEAISLNLANKGSASNMYVVAEAILDGNERFGTEDFALQMARRAYSLDKTYASTLARFFLEGAAGLAIDHTRGVKLLTEAADLNDYVAAYKLASLLETGIVVERDLKEALRLYELVAKADWWFETYSDSRLDDRARVAADRLQTFLQKDLNEKEPKLADLRLGRFKALLIANSDYLYLPDLTAPKNDAEKLAEVLTNMYGFEVEILLDATRTQTLATLNRYRETLAPEENFLLYFAGHGAFDKDINVGFWQPIEAEENADYTWIETARISRTLSGFQSRNILIVADSCYSAAVLRGNDASDTQQSSSVDLQSLIDRKTRMAITSGGLEPVLDSDNLRSNSVFASALLDKLSENRSVITASELFGSIRPAVIERTALLGFDQLPEFAPLYRAGHDGGDFVLKPLVFE